MAGAGFSGALGFFRPPRSGASSSPPAAAVATLGGPLLADNQARWRVSEMLGNWAVAESPRWSLKISPS